jgi:hypothetical protein
MPTYNVLTDEQVNSFLDHGYLVVKDCVDPAHAQRWIDRAYERLGYRADDPATWEKAILWMRCESEALIRDVAPKAWAAILDVVGGEDRLETQVWRAPENLYPVNSFHWSDAMIMNFRNGADRPWQPPSPQVGGWHKDGGYFRHFLDSPEQAMLTIVMWSAMRPQGGATFVSPDSVGVVARYMADHPEGIPADGWDAPALIAQCSRFEEVTGEAGDFAILHPFILHASSQNMLGIPRIITNPPVVLKEPFNYNRSNPDDYSLVERATLKALGVDRYDFQPTAPRQQDWTPYIQPTEPDPRPHRMFPK